MDTTAKIFADNLRRLRIERKLTQEALAECLNTSAITIGNYENGRRWPDPDILDKVAAFFRVPIGAIFTAPGEVVQPTPTEALDIIREALEGQEKRIAELEAKSAAPSLAPTSPAVAARIARLQALPLDQEQLDALDSVIGVFERQAAKLASERKKSG